MSATAAPSRRAPAHRRSRCAADAALARRQPVAGTGSQSARSAQRQSAATRRRSAGPPRRTRLCEQPQRPTRLGGYRDARGRRRELVALSGHAGSLLVVDRDAATLRDRRLVAHLGSDEPAENAALICSSYLSRKKSTRRCRRLHPGDLLASAPGEPSHSHTQGFDPSAGATIQAQGFVHRLAAVEQGRSVRELRWCRRRPGCAKEPWEPIALRDVIAALESYEPVRRVTAAELACRHSDPGVSRRRLRGEYQWLCTTPVVLNRALREAVLQAIDRDGLSMSEIALRCGMVKRDGHGKHSGETSWLARRVGLMPDGGTKQVTPWIHSDVLGLIARDGLRVSPREVEVP
jgi:hypothetical protein